MRAEKNKKFAKMNGALQSYRKGPFCVLTGHDSRGMSRILHRSRSVRGEKSEDVALTSPLATAPGPLL